MSRQFHLIVVGKCKNRSLISLEADYLTRLHYFSLQLHEIKSSGDFPEQEGELVLQKIIEIAGEGKTPQAILLTENGKSYNTQNFAKRVEKGLSDPRPLILVIAGAHGPSLNLRSATPEQLSLSPLTFPHLFARLILIEQLYRAHTILTGHPYHH